MIHLHSFIEGYIEAALHKARDAKGVRLDEVFKTNDIWPATREKIALDCGAFYKRFETAVGGYGYAHGVAFFRARNGIPVTYYDGEMIRAARELGPFLLELRDGKIQEVGQ